MTLTEFMSERYKNREDKDNIFGVGVSDAEFRQFIIDYLLGEDWYVADPIGPTQVNEVALCEILEKYSKYNSHRLPFMDKPIGWGADAPHGWSSDEVIAWMPLPKPYKS